MIKWLFCDVIAETQMVIERFKPLDQNVMIDAYASNRSPKAQNRIHSHGSILERLMSFTSSVSDPHRIGKGNIRHRLADIIILMIIGHACEHLGRADIIEFGIHNINKFRKVKILRNSIPSEATLCRVKNGIKMLTPTHTFTIAP